MKKTTRIYHGGAANSGSGGSGYPPAPDRLLDQAGAVLLQGITNVVHLLTGQQIEADTDMIIDVAADLMAFVVGDIYASGVQVELDASDQIYLYAAADLTLAVANGSNFEFDFAGTNTMWMIPTMKSGINQVAASAIAGEIYHRTTDNALCRGV